MAQSKGERLGMKESSFGEGSGTNLNAIERGKEKTIMNEKI